MSEVRHERRDGEAAGPRVPESRRWQARLVGCCALAGGALGLALAPVMVTIKYMTGWAIVPEPFWVGAGRRALRSVHESASPPELWKAYGSAYTLALLLLTVGLAGLARILRDAGGRSRRKGFWLLVAGFAMVVPGDAVHTWTWSQNGLTVPTPGTNPVANTAYAVHMMGMLFVMIGCMVVGVAALRGRFLARGLAWGFVLVLPSAVLASTTLLPTTPSGALWLYCILMMVCGAFFLTGRSARLR